MHHWTKARLDLYSQNDLELLYGIEKELKHNEILNFYNKVFDSFPLKDELKKFVYGGFSSYDEYFKYGDLFR